MTYLYVFWIFPVPKEVPAFGTSPTIPFPEQETALPATIDRDNGERGQSPEKIAP